MSKEGCWKEGQEQRRKEIEKVVQYIYLINNTDHDKNDLYVFYV